MFYFYPMLQSIFNLGIGNLDSFPLFFLVGAVGLVWGLNEGRKYFTHTPSFMVDASTQTGFKDYENEEVQATPSFMVDASTQTALILMNDASTTTTTTTATAYTQTDVVEKGDVEIAVSKLSYYNTKSDINCAIIYFQYLNRLPSHPET